MVTNVHVASPNEMGEVKSLTAWFPVLKDGDAIHEYDYYAQSVPPIPATVIYTDSTRDLALIQLESLPEKTAAIKLAARHAACRRSIAFVGGFSARESRAVHLHAGHGPRDLQAQHCHRTDHSSARDPNAAQPGKQRRSDFER